MRKLLISTQSMVEFDGKYYYGNTVKALWNRYRPFGDECTLICNKKNVKIPTQDKLNDDCNLVFSKKINSISTLLKNYSSQNDLIAKKEVKKADFCIVHLQSENGYQVIKYCKKYNKPYLTVVCGCPWDGFWNHGWQGKLIAPNRFLKLRRAQKNAPYSIYVTNNFLQSRYPSKGITIGCSNVNIHTGIDGVLDLRLGNIEKRIKDGRILKIGTAAALDVVYKGQEFVIKALGLLKKKGIIYEYHLIGRGNHDRLNKIILEAGVEKQVFIHGALPHEKVIDFMDEMDLYIQPSKQEGLPRALIEAMSRGCFCLGSRTGGIPELLDDKYIFSKGAVSEIAEKLQSISKNDIKEQAIYNYNKAKEYDVDILNQRRSNFIQKFIIDNGL